MRRCLSVIIAGICWLCTYSQKDNQPITSKIEKVTVFMEGAQVERVAQQNLRVGKYNIVFNDISSKIDKQSIQLKADGKLTILSVTHQPNHLKEQAVREEIKQLETQKEQWQEKVTAERNMRNVYSQEEQMLQQNQSIKGDATLKAAELKEAMDFQRQRRSEIYQKIQSIDYNLGNMLTELNKVNMQLIALNQKKDLSTTDIIVAVDVKEAMLANFRLSYLVQQSSWFPAYDVRVQDISKPISLLMKANISQQSGEDWKDVKMFLSTGNPGENGTKPNLATWYLRYYTGSERNVLYGLIPGVINSNGYVARGVIRDSKGQTLPGVTIMVKGTTVGTVTDNYGNFTIKIPPNATTLNISYVGFEPQEISAASANYNITLKENITSLNEVVVTGYGTSDGTIDNYDYQKQERKKKAETAINTVTVYQPTTVVFEIENPYSVPNDGKVYTADINSYELNALYEYYSVPKLDPAAYLTAKVIDWQELNLLPGEANIFFEGTFLGNSFLDIMNAGDTLNLSLGKDKGVVVKKTLMKDYSSKKFLGSNKTDVRQYEIQVRNNKQQPIRIIVEDQFPVSTTKEIEVDKLSYEKGSLDDDTKKITWTFTLDSKKENKLQMGYSVKYPKDKVVQLD